MGGTVPDSHMLSTTEAFLCRECAWQPCLFLGSSCALTCEPCMTAGQWQLKRQCPELCRRLPPSMPWLEHQTQPAWSQACGGRPGGSGCLGWILPSWADLHTFIKQPSSVPGTQASMGRAGGGSEREVFQSRIYLDSSRGQRARWLMGRAPSSVGECGES